MTSHDCVSQMRRWLHLKKIGHGGTLDPAADGVLPIAIGRATRLLPFLPDSKAYRAVIRFGLTTATDDLEGDVLSAQPVPALTEAIAIAPLAQFLGTIQQVPPRYSAIQVQGKRLYDLARQGEVVDVPVRTVTIHTLEVVGWQGGDFPELTVDIACGSGTYIRSIARDWGALLQTGGTLAALTRTQSSGFSLTESLTPAALAAQIQAETFVPIEPAIALRHLPAITLPAEAACRWQQGQKLPWTAAIATNPTRCLVFDPAATFLGITDILPDADCGARLCPKMVFVPWNCSHSQ